MIMRYGNNYLSSKRETASHPRRWLLAVTVMLLCSLELSACSNSSSGGGTSGGSPTASAGTLTQRNDNARSGLNLQEVILTPANVNPAKFGLLFSYPVDGFVYAQPLYMPNVTIGGQVHNVLFVATQHDSVYAFDADMPGPPLWQTSFINPGSGITTVPFLDVSCEDIFPEVGITSTPVIDPNSGTLYVEARTKEVVGGTTNYVHRLHALDIATGAEKFGGPVVIQSEVQGTGDGSVNGIVSFNPLTQEQRAALLLNNNAIYIAFASLCDVDPYHGWVFAYDAHTLTQVGIFNTTPNGGQGGIWNGGPSADANGNLFVITGNGTFDGSAGQDWGDSFLRLTAGLALVDFFTPFNQADLSANDLDLGSAAPLLLPDQAVGPPHLLVSAGKEGRIYLINRDNMGQFQNGSDSQIVQEIVGQLAFGGTGSLFTTPTYFNNTVYFAANGDVLKAFSFVNGQLSTSPVAQGATPFGYPGAEVTISANGSSNGIVWALENKVSLVLHAYLAANVGNELYNSTMNSNDMLEGGGSFVVPTVAKGKVYVGTMSQVSVFGPLS